MLGNGPAAERQRRLADMAKHQSDDDAKGLAAQAKEAEGTANGTALAKLGEAYASYGRFDDASAALEASIRKGGLANPADVQLRLGVAYLKGGQSAKAKATLSAVRAQDGAGDLARLWLIESGAG
jgi:tetratricopeptide (TPR) repeat protein